MITLYGISNCDTMRKAGRWLDQQGLLWRLHDYRKDGLSDALLKELMANFALTDLINRRGTTFRQLDENIRLRLDSAESAAEVLVQYPALIKRPVIQLNEQHWLIGYDALIKALTS